MAIYQPYFYIIQDVRNGMYYAGAKWSKNSNPSNFMVEGGYTTSSKIVNELIQQYGLSNFVVRKIRTFESAEQAYDYETKFLIKVDARNHPRFYNGHNNDSKFRFPDPSFRKIVGPDGLTSYQRGARKASETKRNTIVDGMNLHQITYYKTLDNNPNLHKIRAERIKETMSKVNPKTGMSKYQENGLKIRGENNPSKKPENRKKISEGVKRFIRNNPEKHEEWQEKSRIALLEKDENGLNVHDKHSLWMLENNPTTGSKWFNNGSKNKRVKDGEPVPKGFVEGRLPMKKKAPSKYYNNGERNIRVTEGKKVPDGFVLGFLKKKR